MPNLTLSVPEGLHQRMKKHTELRWSEIARQSFENKLDEIEFMNRALGKSRLTEEDAERIGHQIKGNIRKRFAR